MQIDVDSDQISSQYHYYKEDQNGEPLIRMYGVTEAKNSICLMIEGFYPYFYVKMPKGMTKEHFPAFKDQIEVQFRLFRN